MTIDEAREYLIGLFEPEYHRYIKTTLAGDFAVTLAEKIEESCNKVDADLCAKQCPVCGISDNDFSNAITQIRAEKAQD